MRLKAKVFVLPIVCLLLAAPLFAHHSFNAEFDANKTVVVTGVLTKVEWINPHCFWWVQGKDQNGNEGLWSIQGFAPSELRIANIRRDMAGQAGDQVTVEAYGTQGWHEAPGVCEDHSICRRPLDHHVRPGSHQGRSEVRISDAQRL